MRQSGKTRFVYGGNEHSTSNPNGFGHVVVFPDLSVGADVLDMLKDDNKPGGRFQKGLFPIRPNGGPNPPASCQEHDPRRTPFLPLPQLHEFAV